ACLATATQCVRLGCVGSECAPFFFSGASGAHQDLHSFPTRRSSDLDRLVAGGADGPGPVVGGLVGGAGAVAAAAGEAGEGGEVEDRKSTRLNSSDVASSYAVSLAKKSIDVDRCGADERVTARRRQRQ